MANLADVFTDSERTNWLKAWLAIDIAKSGLEQFAENEVKILQDNIYNPILTSGAVACTGCQTANLLKCPSPGICIKRGANGQCTSMHDAASKQPRPCPADVCNKVLIEIEKQHKFAKPSWKNTEAIHWASCPWQIAKAYLPPDGYTGKGSAQDTDFNGIISFMMNCKHFDNRFSFPIAPGKTHPPCLLTKARDIGKSVRHSSTCKVTETDLQDMFKTLTSLLTDQICLANDVAAQEAVRKLAKLQTDDLKLTTEEIINLLESAQDKLKKVEHISENIAKAMDEMRIYIENCRKDLNAHTHKCKMELDEHTGKCKEQLDEHRQKSTETDYDESCKDFLRRLIAHYNETSSNVPLSNLDGSLDKRIADIYAAPKIHHIEIKKDGKRVKMGRVLTYKEIFCTGDTTNRRIYLQGEPGSGKSTFSAKLVHDWSHGNQVSSASPFNTTAFDDVFILNKFKFLFFITLRDSRGQADVTELIKKQLIDTTFSEDERADVYKLFVRIMNTELSLVIREGLDEWVPPTCSNLAEPCMAGFQNDNCTVLTTSRPWKLADERIKNSQIDILLEINGISDPYKFSKNILRCLIDSTKDLKETAFEFRSFVEDRELTFLSSSPMLYTLVICTWVNTIEERGHLIGSSLCALYTTLLESLCKKANSTTGYFNVSNPPPVHCFFGTSYIQPNIEHLDKLAYAACHLLFSSQMESSIVFSDITLSNYFSPDKFTVFKVFALKAGILTNRKDKTRTGNSYSFVHKTMQELLAAYHIACNPNAGDDVISRYLKRNNTSYLELSQVLIFVCGMNTSAAIKLSDLMNQYEIVDCIELRYCDELYPCEFQRIIQSGLREAKANIQDGANLKLSHFKIDENNIRDLKNIWSTNTSNAQGLCVQIDSDFLSSAEREEPRSHFEFNLSSCHNLRHLHLKGGGIWLRDTVSCAALQFPVWIIINSVDPTLISDPLQVLPSIQHICLERVTCSSTCLRSLFSTLLTLDHQVECLMCDITSSVNGSIICEHASITTKLDNEFNIKYLWNDSPCLWAALHRLNIKNLSLVNEDKDEYENCMFCVKHAELFSQFLSSLSNLETLSIEVDFSIHSLLQEIHGLKIKRLSLGFRECPSLSHYNAFEYLTVNHVESLSQCLASLKQLITLNISVPLSDSEDSPWPWEALRGLNIKSLDMFGRFSVNHLKSLSQSLSSLTQLETLSIRLDEDIPDLWKALRGLHIKNLCLDKVWSGLKVNHVDSMSQSLSSLTQLDTLSIRVSEDSTDPWGALRGLNLKSLSLCHMLGSLDLNHVKSMSQSLSSLTQLETLSISVDGDIHGLWEALHGLNIKSLILGGRRRGLIVNHEESLSQSLLSLKQLETLSIDVNYNMPSLWNALHGMNVKSLSLDVKWMSFDNNVESISKFISSLTQLETLSLSTYWYDECSGLWEFLSSLNIKHLILNVEHNIIVNQVKTASQSLSSLTQLKTLSIRVSEDRQRMWETLRGLKITNLILSDKESRGLILNHVESMSQSLSSLPQLETLSICVSDERPGLWGALCGLNIKRLNLSGEVRVNNVALLSNSISSLSQLETLSVSVKKYSSGLWESLRRLNIKSLSFNDKWGGLRVCHCIYNRQQSTAEKSLYACEGSQSPSVGVCPWSEYQE